jgi:hypothetical protein
MDLFQDVLDVGSDVHEHRVGLKHRYFHDRITPNDSGEAR